MLATDRYYYIDVQVFGGSDEYQLGINRKYHHLNFQRTILKQKFNTSEYHFAI